MKHFLSALFITFTLGLSSSCEKCSTCTTISEDPLTEGETITQDVCGRGREYSDQITVYERSNWTCNNKE